MRNRAQFQASRLDAALRALLPSEVRDEYVVAGEGVPYNAVLGFADHFEVFSNRR